MNSLKLDVYELDIKTSYNVKNGSRLQITFCDYDLESLLIQLLDDYGDDIVINKLNSLKKIT